MRQEGVPSHAHRVAISWTNPARMLSFQGLEKQGPESTAHVFIAQGAAQTINNCVSCIKTVIE